MLEHYFTRPKTVDRIRASWIAEPIERYVAWMHTRGYAVESVKQRVPLLVDFGAYALRRGARTWTELPQHVSPFLRFYRRRALARFRHLSNKHGLRWRVQTPIEEMLRCALPEFRAVPRRRSLPEPFAAEAPEFFSYLRDERGLSQSSVKHYLIHLRSFERYLAQKRCSGLRHLSPKLLRGFVEKSAKDLSTASIESLCQALRGFLRYLHREGIVERNLSPTVERPRSYRLSRVPRSIPWEDTRRFLQRIDRRSVVGCRDFAMMLLLVTYGLRAREVAALTLDDLDWRAGILRIPQRKGGHSTHFRLTASTGEALAAYIENGRPQTEDRHVFFSAHAPLRPVPPHLVAQRSAYWLNQAGISVPRAGSHTLRHTVVQHLLEEGLSLQQIGDFVGHRYPDSTQVYTKIDLRHLREIALGYGEEVLS